MQGGREQGMGNGICSLLLRMGGIGDRWVRLEIIVQVGEIKYNWEPGI